MFELKFEAWTEVPIMDFHPLISNYGQRENYYGKANLLGKKIINIKLLRIL